MNVKNRYWIFAVTVVLFSSFLILASSTSAYASLDNHDPIDIIDNADFSDGDSDGVINPGAAGTEADPYIIENWIIDASTDIGIRVKNTTAHFVIRNCVVENGESSHHGIYLDNVVNGKLENNITENNNNGVLLFLSKSNTLINNVAENNDWAGFYLKNSSDKNILKNNTAKKNYWSGFHLDSSENNSLEKNKAENSEFYGFLLDLSDQNTLEKNQALSTNVWDGFRLENSTHNTLDNNLAENNNTYGFSLWSSENNTLNNNQAQESAQGFYLTNSSDNNFLDKNQVQLNYNNGYFLENSSNNQVRNNQAENNSFSGFLLDTNSSNNMLLNNIAENNGQDGFWLDDYSDNNILENNLAKNNNYNGFHIWDSSHITLLRNSILNNSDAGILIEGSYHKVKNVKIFESSIRNNRDGVLITGGIDENIIILHDNIVGNTGYGVVNENSSVTVMAENNWWGDRFGPSGVGPGGGDAVSKYVDYDPWLRAPYPIDPASFNISNLSISQTSVRPGETVDISATVTNIGEYIGTYNANLRIDGSIADQNSITLDPRKSGTVSFKISRTSPGSYDVSLAGLKDSFKVLEPASFSVSDWKVSQKVVSPSGSVTVSCLVMNTGEISGMHEVVLKTEAGREINSELVNLDAGESKRVEFEMANLSQGQIYTLQIGDLSGEFRVQPVVGEPRTDIEEKPKSSPLAVPMFILTMVIAAVLVIMLLYQEKNK